MFSADKGFDEPGWGTFDTPYDTNAALEIDHVSKVSEKFLDFYVFMLKTCLKCLLDAHD